MTLDQQIGQYVVETFLDSKGHLWFGTLEKGVAKYDGLRLKYLTTKDGLPSNRVVCIEEDKKGNLWFATGEGIAKYDGNAFETYNQDDGLCSNMLSNIMIDSKGLFWIGTWQGVCTYDGTEFKKFELPTPEVDTPINPDTEHWITGIHEDQYGQIWISRDGYGVAIYDGHSFRFVLKSDGLYSNNVTGIEFDKRGNTWFTSRVAERDLPDPSKRQGPGGVTLFNGESYTHFTDIEGFNESDVYGLHQDNDGNIWISTIDHGLYKYDGIRFKNYKITNSIMSMTEDNRGNMWLGSAGGLFKIDSSGTIYNVTVNGPW